MKKYQWNFLSKQQVGAYAEYFVKMELTMFGFSVYGTEVDDRGIDFVARHNMGRFLQIQVKSIRKLGYVFMRQQHFLISRETYLALAILADDEQPELFLIPSLAWNTPSTLFVDRQYIGQKSHPEWGLNLSKKNRAELEQYRFERTVAEILAEPNDPSTV